MLVSAYTWLLRFVLFCLNSIQTYLPKKINQMLECRKIESFVLRRPLENPVWIHCSSGEFEYAKPVIRALKDQNYSVLVTYFSTSVKDNIESTPEVDGFGPLPWDLPEKIEAFLNRFSPCCLLIARTDVWLNTVQVCQKRQIPTLLFSATFSGNSSRLWPVIRSIVRLGLNSVNEIHCVTAQDLQTLQRLGVTSKALVVGDTRYDQVLFRLRNSKPLKANKDPRKRNSLVMMCGSTWPQDEKVLLQAVAKLNEKFKSPNSIECQNSKDSQKNLKIVFVFVPHEVDSSHILHLESEIQSLGLTSLRYSSEESFCNQDILIVDRVGILAELYQISGVAFVGGSFKWQVHSVMEALACGLITLVGPHYKNNREAIEYSQFEVSPARVTVNTTPADPAAYTLNAVEVVRSSDQIVQIVTQLLTNPDILPLAHKKISNSFALKTKRTQDVVTWVRKNCLLPS